MFTRLVFPSAAALILAVTFASPSRAQTPAEVRESRAAMTSVPRLVQFNGTLKDAAARTISGVTSVTFAVYAEQDGGSALWSETQNVLGDANGHFTVLLGTATTGGFPSELFSAGTAAALPQTRWLGITVARQSEMPRVLLASVPYAMKAGDADTLGGLPASSYVTAQQLAAHAAPSTTFISSPGAGGGAAASDSTAAPAANSTANSATQSITQAAVTGTGTANYLPLWTSGSNLGNSKIFQASNGFVGINTTTPLLQLDVNGNSIWRGSFQMAPQSAATAAAGQPSHSFQWQASVFNSSTGQPVNEAFGFRTVPDQNDVANPSAKLDLFYGPGGGTLNDTGLSIDRTGRMTFVVGQSFDGRVITGQTVGVPQSDAQGDGVFTIDGVPYLAGYGGVTNVFVGAIAGDPNISSNAFDDVAVGNDALLQVTTGSHNTAIGADTLSSTTTGYENTAVGTFALGGNTIGLFNTAVGYNASAQLTDGTSNTAVGRAAGFANKSGGGDTFIGDSADAGAPALINSTAIGEGAIVSESSAMVLGATGTSVGIGTSTPGYDLDVVDTGTPTNAGVLSARAFGANRNAVTGVTESGTGSGAGGYFASTAPTGYGVYATANAGGYAGYFNGNVHVAGTLSKAAGSFKIDDPIDPANKFLSHSFVESPDMMNLYNGIVTLDAHGAAVVIMPDWFSALNRDFRYTLTAIGAPAPKIFVAEEMSGNQFKIAGGKKGQRISWMVTGIRHDAYAEAHRIPTEEEKPAEEHGKYLHPELFGAGAEQAIAPATPTQSATTSPDAAGSVALDTGRE